MGREGGESRSNSDLTPEPHQPHRPEKLLSHAQNKKPPAFRLTAEYPLRIVRRAGVPAPNEHQLFSYSSTPSAFSESTGR